MLLKLKIKSNKIPNNPYGILHGAFPTTHLSIPIHTHTHREFRQQYMLSQAQTNLLHNSVNKNMYHESNKRKNVHHKMILPRKVHMFRFKFRNSKKKTLYTISFILHWLARKHSHIAAYTQNYSQKSFTFFALDHTHIQLGQNSQCDADSTLWPYEYKYKYIRKCSVFRSNSLSEH